MAQSLKHLFSAHVMSNLMVCEFDACIGLSAISAEPALDPLSPSPHLHPVSFSKINIKKNNYTGAWVAQSVKRLTLDFSSCHDLMIHGLSSRSGSALTVWNLFGILFLCLHLPLPFSYSLSPLSLN